MTDRRWYQNAIFYQLNVRAFRDSNADGKGDLTGVIEKLDHLQSLGVDCIWLMPFYPSPLKDDGYDVADFTSIHPDFGTVDDLERLVKEAHSRGLKVITDFIVNHTSDEHPWFIESRSSRDNPKRDYYVWSDTDQKYLDARIIFVDVEPSNWTYDALTGQYYWHRFFASQPDLNFDNEEVQQAILDALGFWLDKGIDGFRVDAVPYLFEREGTNGENLPETYAYLRRMRAFIEERWPHAMTLCEANQPPEEVVAYLGNGDIFHMAFHFPVMPRIYMALASGDVSKIRQIMEQTPPIPEGTQWCTFLRNHDELTLEMVTIEERDWMWEKYAPDPAMRRNIGIRRRLAPLLGNDPAKILLANRILFSLPGSPIIYYGDEIGMGDNIALFDRNGVRTPMQWDDGLNAGFSGASPDRLYAPVIDDPIFGFERVNVAAQQEDPASLLNQMRALIATRKAHPALATAPISFIECGDPSVLAFTREQYGETYLILHNVSHRPISVSISDPLLAEKTFADCLRPGSADIRLNEPLEMPPLGSLWLKAK